MTPDPNTIPAPDEVLRELEWGLWEGDAGTGLGRHLCPSCGRSKANGHLTSCRLAAALAASPSSEVADLRAERDTSLTAITDARQVLAEAGCDRPFLDDGVRALVAERDAALARVKVLAEALRHAEAALADIGDADREPEDDMAWCEERAAKALPMVRVALSTAQDGDKEDRDER